MAILVDEGTRLLVQGITGREGAFHTGRMLQSGTDVVAGVTPGKGGQDYEGVPIFDTVEEAVEQKGANASVIFVPTPSSRRWTQVSRPSAASPRASPYTT